MEQVNQYIDQLSVHFDQLPLLKQNSEKFGLKSAHVGLAAVAFAFFIVLIGFGSSLIVQLVGIMYPAYMSFKAIETPEGEDDKQWLTYWVVFAGLNFLDYFADFLFSWIPLYAAFKLGFFIWLFWPKSRGALFIYNVVIRPFLRLHEKEIDSTMRSVEENAVDLLEQFEAKNKGEKKEKKKVNL